MRPEIVIVGADGLVGGCLADALGGLRVVYRRPSAPREVHIDGAADAIAGARVVVNAAGFSARPGLSDEACAESHIGATRRLVPRLARGATLVHVSSASVLGVAAGRALGPDSPPDPDSAPFRRYAHIKLDAEREARALGAARGLRVTVLRPSNVYGPGGHGTLVTLAKLARRGVVLRIVPSAGRQHFCAGRLLGRVAKEAIARDGAGDGTWLVADPFIMTNAELAADLRTLAARRGLRTRTLVVPAAAIGRVLRRGFRSSYAHLDVKTWGEVFGFVGMDVAYDARETYRALGIDPTEFEKDRTLTPFLEAELAV